METRYLYSFRRKPAISEFDWHFTPMHKSSQIFATITSSFLLHLLRVLSNCSCIDHSVSGPIFLDCLFVFTSLSLAQQYHLQIHYTKGTSFFSMTALVSMISGSFHLSVAILFTFHSRYSFTIGVSWCLVLEVWFPFLQTSYWCSTPLSLPRTYGTQLPSLFCTSSAFWLFVGRSPLLHVSLLISFPPGT